MAFNLTKVSNELICMRLAKTGTINIVISVPRKALFDAEFAKKKSDFIIYCMWNIDKESIMLCTDYGSC